MIGGVLMLAGAVAGSRGDSCEIVRKPLVSASQLCKIPRS